MVASAANEISAICARFGVKHYLQKRYRVPALLEKIDESLRETAQRSQRSSTRSGR